jgi:hypothetical protein
MADNCVWVRAHCSAQKVEARMNKLLLALIIVLGAVFTLGCGPIALAIEGGTAGGFLGFQKKEKEKSSNSAPVVILNALTREDAPAAINYSLLDAESNPCSVTVQFRVGAGTFADCTQGAGGDSTTALTSSPGGSAHVFKWDFVADLGSTSLVSNVSIRVSANDGRQGGFSQLDSLSIGNDAPAVSGISSSESSGLFLVTFSLADSSADIGSMTVAYSIDQAQTWTDLNPTGSDFFGNPPLNLLSSATGTPNQFIWNSPFALPNFDGDVFLRLVPSDMPLGYTAPTEGAAVVHGPILVHNTANTGPRLAVLTPLTGSVQANRVRVEFTLADDQSDPGEVFVEWSLDGMNFSPATLANQTQQGSAGPFVTNPAPSRYELVWEALVDFLATAPNTVFLRLTPRDNVNGSAQVFGPLTVFGNTAPEVRSISVSGNSGLVQVTFNIADANSDRVSIVPEMLIGGVPTVLTSADFNAADLTNLRASPTGEDNVLVWNTSIALPGTNQPAVSLRVTPSDLPSSFPAATLTGAAFISGAFAVVNNPGSTVPAQITIACTVPANATTITFGNAYGLTATVLPLGAAQSVNWSVDEGPAYGGMTVWFSPATGIYFAPPVPPAAFRPYVTLRAVSTVDPSISATYLLYWGLPPASVSVTPTSQTVLLGDAMQFAASVAPLNAPQIITWKVVEGPTAGSIDANGTYHAPLVMPPSPTVTIRATSVSGVLGNTTLTLAPRPNRVVVSAPASTLALDATLQFTGQVNPFPDTVQNVRWRVVFDGEDRGSGDAGIGTISPTGLYTAPHFLPRPITVQIEASSNALPAVSGRTTITLTAPLPTSFDVSPATATLIAGGKGQQFSLANLTSNNASSAVVWTRSPALGTVDTEGRYTPPATLIAQTVVLVTATSAVSGSVTASASVTLQPQTGDIPLSVTILPGTPSVPAGGAPVRFIATVSPASSPQAINWRVISGGGTINASGVYTPPSVAIDTQVTIRATSDANGSIFDEYVLSVAGTGSTWFESAAKAIGRDQPSGMYDSINNFFWVIGGKSEASGSRHDTGVFAYDLATNRWRTFASVGASAFHNTICAVLDEDNERIIAVVGDGNSVVELFELDLNAPGGGWSALAAGSPLNSPVLPESFRYLAFWDRGSGASGDERLVLMKDGDTTHTVYRLDTFANAWLAPVNVPVTSGPKVPHACAYVFNPVNSRHFIFGEPGELGPGSGLNVWQVNTSAVTFTAQAQTGSIPAGFLDGAQAAFDSTSSVALVFGGDKGSAGFSATMLTLNLNTIGLAAWGTVTLSGEAVPARAYGAMIATGSSALLFGGMNASGSFGDLWDFNLAAFPTVSVAGLSPTDFVPQGRRWAASAWVTSLDEGYFFGGLTPHGESSELWVLRYDAGLGTVSWSRVIPLGTPPTERAGASLVLDSARNRLILFGGYAANAVISDTYAFDLASRQWSLLAPLGTPPSGRWLSAACLDGNRMFVYGGKQDADTVNFSTGLAGDVNILDFTSGPDGAWTQPVTFAAPDARMGATAGFDAATGKLLVHGGYTQASQANGQLYSLEVSTGLWSAPGIANGSFQPGVFNSACAFAGDIARFISAPHGARAAQSLVLTLPKANWQVLTSAAGEHALGANGLYDEANSRFIVAFGSALQYGMEAGTNRVSVIEFK